MAGVMSPGSGRALRLDPYSLPVRYMARDNGADGQVRNVELDRDRIVLRREVRGISMNPVDHPMGGRTNGGGGWHHPMSPWGTPAKGYKTRKNKRTDVMIVRRRQATKG